VSLQAEMLEFIRKGLDHHNQSCPMPAQAILLNPGNHELFGWEELWGVPVLPDESIRPKVFRIQCDGSATGIEDELEQVIAEQQPVEMPVGPGQVPMLPARPGEPHE